MTIDAGAPAPLWRQVLDDLEARLADGAFRDRFPTDRELVEHYGVSRHTVREAVRHLKARGVIARERGRGSQVVRPEFVESFGTLYSLFAAVETRGVRQASQVLAQDVRPDPTAAERFGVAPDTPLFHLERVRLAGGAPLALDTVWLPLDLGRPLLDADFSHTALYDEMERRCGVRPSEGTEHLSPVLPDAALREVLALADDEAVLRIQREGRIDGRPVECRTTLVRGSRFGLVSEWPARGVAMAPVVDPT